MLTLHAESVGGEQGDRRERGGVTRELVHVHYPSAEVEVAESIEKSALCWCWNVHDHDIFCHCLVMVLSA